MKRVKYNYQFIIEQLGLVEKFLEYQKKYLNKQKHSDRKTISWNRLQRAFVSQYAYALPLDMSWAVLGHESVPSEDLVAGFVIRATSLWRD